MCYFFLSLRICYYLGFCCFAFVCYLLVSSTCIGYYRLHDNNSNLTWLSSDQSRQCSAIGSTTSGCSRCLNDLHLLDCTGQRRIESLILYPGYFLLDLMTYRSLFSLPLNCAVFRKCTPFVLWQWILDPCLLM